MKGQRSATPHRDGQALIQVALMLVLLMGFLALAIDISYFLSVRRQMQNAADAGALAGARAMCQDPHQNQDTLHQIVHTAAVEYATVNLAEEEMTTVDMNEDNQVSVTTGRKTKTIFGGILGVTSTDIYAEATAACGTATSACTIFPVAFRLDKWNEIVGSCESGQPLSERFWIFDSEQEIDCETLDCDLDGDGEDDIIASGSQRAWLDFAKVTDDRYPDNCSDGKASCDTKELICRVSENHNAEVELPACIPGTPGSRSTLFTPPNDHQESPLKARVGDTVRIPLYDSYCTDGPKPSGSCHDGLYHVVKFGCVKIVSVTKNYFVKVKKKDKDKEEKEKESYNVIEVQAHCNGCPTNCGDTLGGPAGPGDVRGVRLIQ